MNIQKLLNVSPDKLYDLLDLEESKNDNKNNYDVWFYNLKNNNLDISKLLLILKNMDNIQWKNIYTGYINMSLKQAYDFSQKIV